MQTFSHLVHDGAAYPPRAIHTDDLSWMRQVPLLTQLPANLLGAVLAEAMVIRYDVGETLFHQGEAPHYLHVVMDGQVCLYGVGSDGNETVMEIMKCGDVFIAAAVLTNLPYLMEARALSQSRVMLLPAERLRRDLRSIPDLALAMLTSVSSHYRMLVREVKALKLKSTNQRLALYLLSLTPKREGTAILWLPHSKGVISARIGIRPETLSRAFAALQQYGVQMSGTRVSVADLGVLADFCRQNEDVL
ncbi:MAG TPA: cyclic nucleotide-binding domain-containing protein [Magnetospirillum sp.]|jgi:CRP/FNR family transcriptional activator FtrB|nr:cyclic nucleotide-binding domain-containing protein [Magnetospirillum sp.]